MANRSFKPSKIPFPHLSLTGVPLDPFLRKHKKLTEFTYNGTFAQPIDRLLEFLEMNRASLRSLNLEDITFQSPELRQPSAHNASPADHERLQHLRIASDEVEDIKALISHIPLKPTGDVAEIRVISDNRNTIETIHSVINAKYYKGEDFLSVVVYAPGIGFVMPRSRKGPVVGPQLTLMVGPGLRESCPLTLENMHRHLGSPQSFFKNIEHLSLAMTYSKGEEFNKLLFPALKRLAVYEDHNLSRTLSKLFSPERTGFPTSIETIIFDRCPRFREFVEKVDKDRSMYEYKYVDPSNNRLKPLDTSS